MKVVAIITTRWDSTRLPGKALIDICGKPMLQRIIDQIKKSKLVDEIVVATTESSQPIINYCKGKVPCYAGSETDILDRLYKAALFMGAEVIVYVWGDCPLISPDGIDLVITHFINHPSDYVYNTGWAKGQTVAVMPVLTLKRAMKIYMSPYQREWIHEYFVSKKHHFRVKELKHIPDMSHINYSVDTQEDLERIKSELLSEVCSA